MNTHSNKPAAKMIFGAVLIAIGVLFILHNFNIFYFDEFVEDFWPLLIIIAGLYFLFKRPHSIISGSALVLLGMFLQLRELNIICYPYVKTYFSVFVIIMGLILIIYSRKTQNDETLEEPTFDDTSVPPKNENELSENDDSESAT
ncbi:MAG: hypothetical protein KAR38_14490 [Calditrichia bacterium]|nr:hypothetical protein [Calditrichia bacterium]